MPEWNFYVRLGILAATALCLPPAARAETIPPKPIERKIKWVYSYTEGKKAAREANKPLFVVFRCER